MDNACKKGKEHRYDKVHKKGEKSIKNDKIHTIRQNKLGEYKIHCKSPILLAQQL
jgi:hypothetical protein